ncbi:hypothetical protein ACPPVV_04565 [Rhodanobacter sp. Col0626]|uniref:hypothetical protein n=1 Tax=Rhodanobacter sp. Col0626 TaxID=3415679 RepID=UPI003CE9BBE0
MSDDERRESIDSGYALMRLIVWGIAAAAILFYQAHAQKIGRLGGDGIFISAGSLVLLETLFDIRSGTSTLILSTFKRSENSPGFWTSVAVSGILGGVLVFGALGDLLGLWRF